MTDYIWTKSNQYKTVIRETWWNNWRRQKNHKKMNRILQKFSPLGERERIERNVEGTLIPKVGRK